MCVLIGVWHLSKSYMSGAAQWQSVCVTCSGPCQYYFDTFYDYDLVLSISYYKQMDKPLLRREG
jgi:hypothetical protein